MQRRDLIKQLALAVPGWMLAKQLRAAGSLVPNSPSIAPIKGPFKPTWDSLSKYQIPAWFRNAKFGMWAHWGPQCEPEDGDWYARYMYVQGSDQYNFHVKKYGHPSKFGFKDVIHQWTADQWDPESIVSLYKKTGARYFMAMANHHDNLDLYNSKYQPNWNSTKLGPKKDIIGGWEKAARANGLPFGVSVHAAHAWSWYETAQQSDKTGPLAGVPYDGKLTKADGKGQWWEGLDPQELYTQNHPLSEGWEDARRLHKQWNWGDGVCEPSKAFIEQFYNRTIDLIDSYNPDLIYFDDTALPFHPISDAGLRIAAHLYNKSIQDKGQLEAVIFGKILDELQRQCMVWDIEKGQSNEIEPLAWQTDTCIGGWHYSREIYDKKRYKSAKTGIHILSDVVSKNGNLLLNIPVRGNGSIDEQELAIVEEIGQWMRTYSEAIYDTRPWKVFGEGPAIDDAPPLSRQGFNEKRSKPYTPEDIRFTAKGDLIYAIALAYPENHQLTIKSMREGSLYLKKSISKVSLVGGESSLKFSVNAEGLHVQLPENRPSLDYTVVLNIV